MLNENDLVTVKLRAKDLQVALNALACLPYKESADIIGNIVKQCRACEDHRKYDDIAKKKLEEVANCQ